MRRLWFLRRWITSLDFTKPYRNQASRLAVPDKWKVRDVLLGQTIGKAAYLFKKVNGRVNLEDHL